MFFLAALALAVAIFSVWRWRGRPLNKKISHEPLPSEKTDSAAAITPLKCFDWEQTPPDKHRPFKPVYHITMAIQGSTPDDLIIMDSNYLDRVNERRETIKHHAPTVLGAVPEGIPVSTRHTHGQEFYNKVTKTSLPLTPLEDPNAALQALGETIEDDIFLLVETPEGHRAVAFICCHPAGFDPSDKLGKLLKDIHTPVPSYEKIGASMERFFSRLQVGKSVKRMNWSISTSERLFSPSGLHIYDGDKPQEDEDIDISKTRLRQELQTLTRLPKTGAIMFSFKTYMTPLEEIKNEGIGPQVADAIEGLKSGNAPGMWVYKGATRWGKGACEYLRS
ncbi:hypothetical protein CGCSCA1_v004507 [Colletotrichum siamense]|nr:hypothetical protein CGCSCA1_v004507 [Colletotrichum siamense]